MLIPAFLLAAGLSAASDSAYCNLSARSEPLPGYPPPVQVFNFHDDELTDHARLPGEFASLEVVVAYVRPNQPWVPSSVEDAAFALREMLPSKFYGRLVLGYDREHRLVTNNDDGAFSERIWDVARFLETKWGLRWSGRNDALEALAVILEFETATGSHLVSRCSRKDM